MKGFLHAISLLPEEDNHALQSREAGHIYMVRIQKIHYLLSAYHSTRIALDHHIFDTAEKQPVLWESAVLLKASNNVCNLCQSCLHT